MTDILDIDGHKVGTARKYTRRKKPVAKPAALKLVKTEKDPFAGVTESQCCADCTEERCVISTVNLCKHPYKTGPAGCGPITLENRTKVMKIIQHRRIDR